MLTKFVLFGPPGSGKGTLAKYISNKLDIQPISTGDVLRKEVASKSELGCAIASTIESGSLVSDVMMNDLVFKYIGDAESYILDGYPRTELQVRRLMDFNEPQCLIIIESTIEKITNRLLNRGKEEGRKDDDINVIQKRIKIYKEETEQVVDYWLKNYSIDETWFINGNASIEDVRKQFDDLLID